MRTALAAKGVSSNLEKQPPIKTPLPPNKPGRTVVSVVHGGSLFHARSISRGCFEFYCPGSRPALQRPYTCRHSLADHSPRLLDRVWRHAWLGLPRHSCVVRLFLRQRTSGPLAN